jgi:hypothetical protein
MSPADDERLEPAEARVAEHLASLRSGDDGPVADGDGFARGISRTVRWQRAARPPLRLAGARLAALGDGVGLLVRGTRRGT